MNVSLSSTMTRNGVHRDIDDNKSISSDSVMKAIRDCNKAATGYDTNHNDDNSNIKKKSTDVDVDNNNSNSASTARNGANNTKNEQSITCSHIDSDQSDDTENDVINYLLRNDDACHSRNHHHCHHHPLNQHDDTANESSASVTLTSTHDVDVAVTTPIHDNSKNSTGSISYWNLLCVYTTYRNFIMSYIVTQLGEWLTYIATLSIIQELTSSNFDSTDSSLISSYSINSTNSSYPLVDVVTNTSQQQQQQYYYISLLVICRLLPNTFCSIIGGCIADRYNRKSIMIVLDVCGGCIAVLYTIIAVTLYVPHQLDSITNSRKDPNSIVDETTSITVNTNEDYILGLLFLCTIAQSTISGLYQPSRSAIVPMLLSNTKASSSNYNTTNTKNEKQEYRFTDVLEKANEISSIIWSLSAAVGSSLGGYIVYYYGVTYCFMIDTLMYYVSAIILYYFVHGNHYNASDSSNDKQIESSNTHKDIEDALQHLPTTSQPDNMENSKNCTKCIRRYCYNHMVYNLLYETYIYTKTNDSFCYLYIKTCGAFLFGASDVINVTIASSSSSSLEENNYGNSTNMDELDSQRLGYLFTAIGIGCLLGPILMPPRRCYMTTCILSYYVISIGYFGMGYCSNFWWKCFYTGVKASGSAVLWVDSTILIQLSTPSTILGRITSIDLSIALLAEAISAFYAGYGQDNYGMSAEEIAFTLSGVGFVFGVLWTVATIYQRRWCKKHFDHQTDHRIGLGLSSVELEPLNDHNI